MSKKNFKSKEKEDLDPILKKRVPKSKVKEEDANYVFEDDDELDSKPEEEKLSFDKFRDLFRPKKASKSSMKRILKEENKLKLIDSDKNFGYEKLPFAPRNSQALKNHFDCTHETLIKSKLQLVSEALPATQNSFVSQFSYDFDDDDDEEMGQAEKLNNQIKVKEYKLNGDLKSKGKLYSDQSGQVWLTDNCLESVIKKEKGLQSGFDIHETILKNMGTLDVEEEQEFKENVFKIMESYVDMVYSDANEQYVKAFREAYIAHALNHVLKCKALEKENEIKMKAAKDTDEAIDGLHKVRGYTSPRILIVAAYRGDAFEIANLIKKMYTGKEFKQKGKKSQRFFEEYTSEDNLLDDHFRIGIQLFEGKMALYSPFKIADIIIGSPLGLRTAIGSESDKNRDYSFLSSIEILVIERCQIIQFQNWQHIEEIMKVMNKIPRHKDMTSDINEIREYYYEGMSKFYRQNIIHSEYKFAEINSISARYFENYEGMITNRPFYHRLINDTEVELNQEFMKFDVDTHEKEADIRFEHFKTKIWEKIRSNEEFKKVVLFASSYFEFVRLRSYFKKTNANVVFISEYANPGKAQSRLAKFNNGAFRYLLITERALFYNICNPRNTGHLIFYSLPKNALLYRELVMNLENVKEGLKLPKDQGRKLTLRISIKSIFCKFDALTIERVVGTDKCKEYIAEYNKNTVFVL